MKMSPGDVEPGDQLTRQPWMNRSTSASSNKTTRSFNLCLPIKPASAHRAIVRRLAPNRAASLRITVALAHHYAGLAAAA